MKLRMMSMIFMLLLSGSIIGGCGGNGGGPVTNGGEPPMPPPEMTPVDLTGLPAVMLDNNLEIAPGTSSIVGDVEFSCPSGGSLCTLSQNADGTITSTGGMATAMLSEDARNRNAAMIMGLTMAIADPDGDGEPTGGLNKADRPGGTASMISALPDGVIRYGEDDRLGIEDEDVADQFGMPAKAATLTKWNGTTQSRTVDNVMTELTVYDNAEDPKDVAYMTYFSTQYAEDNPNSRPEVVGGLSDSGDNMRYDADADGEGTLTLSATAEAESISMGDAKLFGGTFFSSPAGDQNTKMVLGADETPTGATAPRDGQNERSGTFAGVPGTFVCGGGDTSCTATFDAEGVLTALSAEWTFRPDAAGARGKIEDVMVDVDYLSFGYWVETTTEADGSKTYGVNTFATGAMAFNETDMMNVFGTATYNGRATGMYAVKDFSTGAGVPSAAGQFTAEARLTASFGGSSVAEDDHYSINGVVTDFRDTAGEQISGGAWQVGLNKITFGRTSNTFTGGSTTGGGSWQGGFYGATESRTDNSNLNQAPRGVAGEFNAHFGNGHVIGAFGATR